MFAACLHHVCITFASCLHPVRITFASCLHHVRITFASCLHHVCIMFASCLHHVRITFASCLHHVCIMFAAPRSKQFIRASYRLPECSSTSRSSHTQCSGTWQWHVAVARGSGTWQWHVAVVRGSGTCIQWHEASSMFLLTCFLNTTWHLRLYKNTYNNEIANITHKSWRHPVGRGSLYPGRQTSKELVLIHVSVRLTAICCDLPESYAEWPLNRGNISSVKHHVDNSMPCNNWGCGKWNICRIS